ncbi:hypothetical protein BDR26DRAFT_920701 [Obelidium mucronatum]|nr:hypothetical protein BDR26DRAFT_920701 [Obelidium mucronatum]
MLEIPAEVSKQIVQHLPIDNFLQSIGFASTSFGNHIFCSHHSANSHFAQCKEQNCKALRSLEKSVKAWNSLPFIYRCALYSNWFLTEGDRQWGSMSPITRSSGLRLHNYFKFRNPSYLYGQKYLTAATTFGLLEVVQECVEVLPHSPSFDLTDALPPLIKLALVRKHSDLARFLINLDCFNPAARNGEILTCVAGENQVEFVEKILKDSRMDGAKSFLGLYSMQYAVANGHLAVVRCMMEDPRIQTLEQESNKAFCRAISQNYPNWPIARYFVGLDGFDPSVRNYIAFLACSSGDRVQNVSIMRIQADTLMLYSCCWKMGGQTLVTLINERCLSDVMYDGFIEVVRLLLTDGRIDPSANENAAVVFAVQNQSLELLRLLLANPRVVDPFENENGSRVIQIAVKSRNLEILNELLLDDRLNPETSTWKQAMRWAATGSDVSIMKRLLSDFRVDPLHLILQANVDWFLEVADILSQDPRLNANARLAVSELKAAVVAFHICCDADPTSMDREFERKRSNDILQGIIKQHKL